MEYKLKETTSKDAFNYGYLLKRLYPYIKPVMGRALINLLIAIPLETFLGKNSKKLFVLLKIL